MVSKTSKNSFVYLKIIFNIDILELPGDHLSCDTNGGGIPNTDNGGGHHAQNKESVHDGNENY